MDLTPQQPAEGISKMTQDLYRIDCACGSEKHQIVMDVDFDEDDVNVEFYVTAYTPYWRDRVRVNYSQPMFIIAIKENINSFINRIAIAYTVLTKGYVEMEASTILRKQAALNLSALLAEELTKDRSHLRGGTVSTPPEVS